MGIGVADIICIVFVVFWFFIGFRKGGVYTLLRLAVVAVSFVAAFILHPHIRDLLKNFLNYTASVDLIVFCAAFLIIAFVANGFLGRFINAFSGSESMSTMYKITGGVFEAVQGLFYAGAILLILSAASDTLKPRLDSTVCNFTKTAVTKTYNQMNKIIRKQDISPIFNTIEDLYS